MSDEVRVGPTIEERRAALKVGDVVTDPALLAPWMTVGFNGSKRGTLNAAGWLTSDMGEKWRYWEQDVQSYCCYANNVSLGHYTFLGWALNPALSGLGAAVGPILSRLR